MTDPTKMTWVQWLVLGIQAATLVVLVIYVWKTWEMAAATRRAAEATAASVQESRQARREATDPRIAIYFGSPTGTLAEIVVENHGESTATNVSFVFEPPLQASQQREAATRFFDTPKTLPAHTALRHAFDDWPAYLKADLPRKYNVVVRFQRLGEATIREETHILDAGSFEHYARWQIKRVHELTQRFERFADRVEQFLGRYEGQRQRATERHDLLVEPRPLSAAQSDLLATLELLEKAAGDESAEMFPGLYLPALRKHALAAFLAAAREGSVPELRAALADLLLALYHGDWDLLNQSKARAKLEEGVEALRKAIGYAGPPAA
jgi:hypothetical protein